MPGRRKRWMPCDDCGEPTFKLPRVDRPIYCLDCGLAHANDAARQMADKTGPAWDAWLASNANGASAPRTPPKE